MQNDSSGRQRGAAAVSGGSIEYLLSSVGKKLSEVEVLKDPDLWVADTASSGKVATTLDGAKIVRKVEDKHFAIVENGSCMKVNAVVDLEVEVSDKSKVRLGNGMLKEAMLVEGANCNLFSVYICADDIHYPIQQQIHLTIFICVLIIISLPSK